MSTFITKFPMSFGADGRVRTTSQSKDQFDLFTNVRPFTLVRKPEYGIDGTPLLQNPVSDRQQLLSIYLIALREKISQYFQNIIITRGVGAFNKDTRSIDLSIFIQEENEETEFNFSIDIE